MAGTVRRVWVLSVLIVAATASLFPLSARAAEKASMDGISWPREGAGWKKTGPPALYDRKTIFGYIDGAGEVFLAYNLRQLTVYRFERPRHAAVIAELYEMGTPEDAFGVFSFDRQDPEAGIGQGSEYGGGMLRFWKGRYFASIFSEGETGEEAVQEIGRRLASAIQETGRPPDLLRVLPRAGLVEGSEKFVRSHVLLNQRFFVSYDNILDLAADTEAVLARYTFGKQPTYLLVIRYGSPGKAAAALARFRKAYMPEAGPGGVVRTEDGTWTGAQADGADAVILFHAPDEARLRAVTSEVRTLLKEERR